MKSFGASYAAHIATRATTIAHALKVTRPDLQVFGFTSHDIDDTVPDTGSPTVNVLYRANTGIAPTSIVTAAGLGVGNLELKTLHDGSIFTLTDIAGGIWKNSKFIIFRYNYADLAAGVGEYLLVGTFGELELKQSELVIELRDLRQYFQQPVGSASSKNCRYRLGDTKCGVVLSGGSPTPPWTVTGTITGVGDNQTFADSARTEATDFFGQGTITITSGANAGIMRQIKEWNIGSPLDKTFYLWQPFPNDIVGGETYTAVAGCRLRFTEDCVGKFSNGVNFGGEPHRPLIDAITQDVRIDV